MTWSLRGVAIAALAGQALLFGALAAPAGAVAAAYTDCVSGGPTSADTAMADALRSRMNSHLGGGTLDAYEVSCARRIVAVTQARNFGSSGQRAAVIAVTTAIAESSLHNYTVATDHDSLGLFQQRPSQGWGTAAQITDAAYATNAFLNAMVRKYPNDGWHTGDIGTICQTVQVSAYPSAYTPQVNNATVLVAALWPVVQPSPSGTAVGGPAVSNTVNGNLEVYANSGGRLTEAFWSPATGGWSTVDLGAPITGRPVAVQNSQNHNISVFYNSGGRLAESWWNAQNGAWQTGVTANPITGNPVVLSNPVNHNTEVYYDSGGTLAERWWNAATGAWSDAGLGTPITGSPSVVYNEGNGNIEVYLNSGGSLVERYWSPGTGAWSTGALGRPISGDPAGVYNPGNHNVEVYYTTGGNLAESYWDHATGAWRTSGFNAPTSGDAVAPIYNRANRNIEVYYNASGVLTEIYWTPGGQWSSPLSSGIPITGSPWAVNNLANQNLEVYLNSGGVLTENYWSPVSQSWSGARSLGTPIA